jgi:hypothetical protein
MARKLAGLTGRAAACKRCNGGQEEDPCACLLFCGRPGCTGDKDPKRQGNVPLDFGHQGVPEGLKPPRYDGPRGKA